MTVNDVEVDYDPYNTAIIADPYPVYARLREEAPLYYNEKFDFYAVSRFADCAAGLNDWQTFSSGRGAILELIKSGIELPPGTVLFEDPPVHDIHRALLARAFTPRRIAALEPSIRDFAVRCLDPLVGRPRFDLIAELGAEFPSRVIGMLFGMPDEYLDAVRVGTDLSIRTEPGRPIDYEKRAAMIDGAVLADYVAWREQHPGDDMMTNLLTAEFEDIDGSLRKLTREEVITYAAVVLGAGNETINRLLGWITVTLARHPDARAELVAEPALIPNAVEEVLRYEPPAPHIARYVARDAEFHGQAVPEGSAILFIAAAANRDPRRWDDADRFDIHRQVGNQLVFGLGPHYCLGSSLARMEARIALEEILVRFPAWDVDYANAELSPTSTVRGWERLPVIVG